MLKERLLEWRESQVTQEQSKWMMARVVDLAEEILASHDSSEDLYRKGMVRAFREVLDWDPEVVDEEIVEDEVQSGNASTQSYN